MWEVRGLIRIGVRIRIHIKIRKGKRTGFGKSS